MFELVLPSTDVTGDDGYTGMLTNKINTIVISFKYCFNESR